MADGQKRVILYNFGEITPAVWTRHYWKRHYFFGRALF